MNRRIWTKEEDNYIIENFNKISFSKMADYFNCGIVTVQRRAISLGLPVERKTIRRWTEEEIKILKELSETEINTTIAEVLNRSVEEVNKYARKIGIKLIFKRRWTKEQKEYLKKNLNKIPFTTLIKNLGHDYHVVMRKIEELGLEYYPNRWTEEEEALLVELSSKYYIKEIAKRLNRSEGAIVSKAHKMGIELITLKREFTEKELKYIRKNWGVVPITDMARKLGVSRIMIDNQAKKMNLPKLGNNPYKKWTKKKIDKLKVLAEEMTITELANYFKTTNEAIITVAHKNNIKLINNRIHWTEEDNNILREYASMYSLQEISEKMNRSSSSIRVQARRLNIKILSNEEYQNSIWTEENTKELRKLVGEGKYLLEITKIMNKKDFTILKKAKELGLTIKRENQRKWTREEQEELIELSKTKKISELVKILDRTSSSIKDQARRLGITLIPDRRNWTEEEYKLLEKLVVEDKKSPKEIASILNRSEDSITIKINRRGLKIKGNDKRFWTSEEEEILSDLWGTVSVDKIAEKLDRTVSSLKNKAYQLGLGSQMENNYDGISITQIAELFNVNDQTVSIYWISLGLKTTTRNISKTRKYRYVTINDLFDFLEKNQNIWDSRYLEKNILGKEPDWLTEKRKSDREKPIGSFGIDYLTKQQLIQTKKYLIDNYSDENKSNDNPPYQKVKKRNGGDS